MKNRARRIIGTRLYDRARYAYGRIRIGVRERKRRIAETVGCFRCPKVALYGQDDRLAPYLNFRNGFFIEAGANDGVAKQHLLP